MEKKMANGMMLGCGPLLRLSETENTTMRRTKVPINCGDEESESFNADVCSEKTGATLTSSKKQLLDDT
jgi:hypothetical protein